ncbi:hypothetical protein [Collimonas arenae]|uniref:hypothetical protein n=1 Tax=Collimonas arenae TaxID=279058 RepID=UPI000571FB55|nr:hypothetical protein [Collimonas arenae]
MVKNDVGQPNLPLSHSAMGVKIVVTKYEAEERSAISHPRYCFGHHMAVTQLLAGKRRASMNLSAKRNANDKPSVSRIGRHFAMKHTKIVAIDHPISVNKYRFLLPIRGL